jgi:hypothetical protein
MADEQWQMKDDGDFPGWPGRSTSQPDRPLAEFGMPDKITDKFFYSISFFPSKDKFSQLLNRMQQI